MANPERGELALTVKDRQYTMVLDFEALATAEGVMSHEDGRNVPIAEIIVAACSPAPSYRHMRALMIGALKSNHPSMTPAEVGQFIVDAGGPQSLLKSIAKLRGLSEPEGESRPPKARRSKAGARTTSTPGASASARMTSGG